MNSPWGAELPCTPWGHALGCFDSLGIRCNLDQECSSKNCHVQAVMQYVCWRLMVVSIISLPGAARRTVCMEPNSFQVPLPKSWCPAQLETYWWLPGTLSLGEPASSLTQRQYPPVLFFAAAFFIQLSFWVCSLLGYPEVFHRQGVLFCALLPASYCVFSSQWSWFLSLQMGWRALAGGHVGRMQGSTLLRPQSSGEHAVLLLRSCAWRSTEGPAIQTAAAIQTTSKMKVFFKGNQWHTNPVCNMANSTFLH